jgi:hypothetical protein
MTDLGASPEWEDALWEELNHASPIEQIVMAGEWIVRMTQVLLPQLGVRRREAVLAALALPDMDATRLAEELGTRPTTIKRLAEEGRSTAKHRRDSLQLQDDGGGPDVVIGISV